MSNPAPSGYDTYTSPLAARNASPEMLKIWSPRHKFNTWRRIWLAIAEAQHEVTKGWDTPLVSQEQVEELRAVVERGITDEELARASDIERDLRHDVMAHVHCLGESCPTAKPIIHLGCTSQDVACNADLALLDESVRLILDKARMLLAASHPTIDAHKGVPCLGFTHYQSAQPSTVGRRIAGWMNDLSLSLGSLNEVSNVVGQFPYEYSTLKRGLRGATGTQASFLNLFDGDTDLVDAFELEFI
ncbi:MAG: lyase family protein, partial [Planctomycetota bacterium]